MLFVSVIQLSVGINGNNGLFDQLVNFLTVSSAEGDGNHTVHVPAGHHLKYLLHVLCGTDHHIIILLLDIFLDKTDDFSVKGITENRILEVLVIVHHDSNQLRFFLVQYPESQLLYVAHFPDQRLYLVYGSR